MLYNTILEQFEDDLFNEETQYIVEPLDEAVVFISNQGKNIKRDIKEIFANNVEKISGAKKWLDLIFKSKTVINEQVVNKIVNGVEKLGWDSFAKSKLFRVSAYDWQMGFTGRKGDYLYNFYITFNYSGTAAVIPLLGFSEKNLSSFVTPKKAVDETIKNIKPMQWCKITKKYIQVFDLIDDLNPSTGAKVSYDFYEKLHKMFPNNSKINKEAQRIEFFGKID